MANVNVWFGLGNLTRDAELRYIPSGTALCTFTLATNRSYTSNDEKREETLFIDCTLWGKRAEALKDYLTKGKQVMVQGRLKLDRWEDKATGQARSKIGVVVSDIQLLGGGRRNGEHRQAARAGSQQRSQYQYQQAQEDVYL